MLMNANRKVYTQQVISVNGTHGSAEQVPPLNLLSSHWSDSVCERKESIIIDPSIMDTPKQKDNRKTFL